MEHRDALDKIADYLIRRETITGKEFMKILRAVENGMEIPDNLNELPDGTEQEEAEQKNEAAEIAEPDTEQNIPDEGMPVIPALSGDVNVSH